MKIRTVCVVMLLTALESVLLLGAAPSLNDLVPPAVDSNAPKEVQNPQAVNVTKVNNSSAGSTSRVQAATAQDAVNKARTLKSAVTEIQCGSGIGYVATGSAVYSKYRNRNAQLIGQRGAYMEALAQAKGNLAKYLYGMNVKAKEELKNTITSLDTDEESKALYRSYRVESVDSVVEATLRGYSVYSVEEDPQKRKVTVSIFTSPRTRAAAMTVSAVGIASSDFRSAMQKLLAELSTKTLPPEGAKVFFIPDAQGNRQVFCVGFGSAIVKENKNERLASALEDQAQKVSALRAERNLVALLHGEKTVWESGHIDVTKEREADPGIRELLKKTKNDDLAKPMGLDEDKSRENFLNVMRTTNAYKSATEGRLPPGVDKKYWTDENGDWAYALYIYNPNMTASVIQNRDTIENLNARPTQKNQAPAPQKNRQQGINPLDRVETDANEL